MINEPIDPVMDALSELRAVLPRESHDLRVRRRCHAALAKRRTATPLRPFRPADLMVAAAIALYIVTMVTEAVRLLG